MSSKKKVSKVKGCTDPGNCKIGKRVRGVDGKMYEVVVEGPSATKRWTQADKPLLKKKSISPKKEKSVTPKSDVPACVSRSKLPLKAHQKQLVEALGSQRGVIAVFQTGSGKTLAAVAASQCYLDANPNGKVYVLAPTSLISNFKKEIEAYGIKDMKHYHFYNFQKFSNKFAKQKFDSNCMMIIDEAHNLRTDTKPGAKIKVDNRSSIIIKCASVVNKILLLTATPVYNNPYDVVNLVSMVKGTQPMTKYKFEQLTENLLNKNVFRDYFSCTMSFFRTMKDDNYPTVKIHDVPIIMSDEYYKEYHKVEMGQSSLYKDAKPFAFLTGVRQATNQLKTCAKCDWVVNKVKEGKKTVIYSSFLVKGIDILQKMLKASGIGYLEVSGRLKKDDRDKAVADYNSGKVKVLFISKAGSEGLDLKGTRNVIIFESMWNKPSEEQVIGRAARFKSHEGLHKDQKHVDVYRIYLKKPAYAEKQESEGMFGYYHPSADDMLRDIDTAKEKKNNEFIKRLEELSIEKLGCKKDVASIWAKAAENIKQIDSRKLKKVAKAKKVTKKVAKAKKVTKKVAKAKKVAKVKKVTETVKKVAKAKKVTTKKVSKTKKAKSTTLVTKKKKATKSTKQVSRRAKKSNV